MNQKRFKNGIDVIDLLNASDASVLQNTFTKAQWGNVSLLNKRGVRNDLFSEYGFTQPILFWDFSSTYTNKY